jgi:hypothetical protein
LIKGVGLGLVEDQKIDLVHAELLGALFKGAEGGVEAVVTGPDLRLRNCLTAGDS